MSRSTLITGASVSLYINGKRFAKVIDFRWMADTPQREIRGIDVAEALELAPTTAGVSGSMTLYRQSQDAGAEGAGLSVPFPELSRQKYYSMMLIEANSNTILFEARRCSTTAQDWSAATRSYVTGSVSFKAIDWSNELRPIR